MTDYEYYKEKGYCVKCHHQKAAKDRVMCLDCAALSVISATKYRDTHKEKVRIYHTAQNRKRRERLHTAYKENGTCAYCGRAKAIIGYKGCALCVEKNRKYYYRTKKRFNYEDSNNK